MNTTAEATRAADHVLDDGQIVFACTVQGGKADGHTVKFDLLTLMMAFHPVEAKHGALAAGATLTAEFYNELAGAIGAATNVHVSPTVAYQIWQVAWQRWAVLKKNMSNAPA